MSKRPLSAAAKPADKRARSEQSSHARLSLPELNTEGTRKTIIPSFDFPITWERPEQWKASTVLHSNGWFGLWEQRENDHNKALSTAKWREWDYAKNRTESVTVPANITGELSDGVYEFRYYNGKKEPHLLGKAEFTVKKGGHESIVQACVEIYKDKIEPLEKCCNMNDFFDLVPWTEGEIKSKPMVLLVGSDSVGKTSLIHELVQQEYKGSHVGAGPSTTKFFAIVSGGSGLPSNEMRGDVLVTQPVNEARLSSSHSQ